MKQRDRSDLDLYMYKKGFTDAAFAAAVTAELAKMGHPGESVSASSVTKWRLGITMPRKRKLVAIGNICDGEVTAESFAHAKGPQDVKDGTNG